MFQWTLILMLTAVGFRKIPPINPCLSRDIKILTLIYLEIGRGITSIILEHPLHLLHLCLDRLWDKEVCLSIKKNQEIFEWLACLGYDPRSEQVTYSNIQVGNRGNPDSLVYSNLMHPQRGGSMYSNLGSPAPPYGNGGEGIYWFRCNLKPNYFKLVIVFIDLWYNTLSWWGP